MVPDSTILKGRWEIDSDSPVAPVPRQPAEACSGQSVITTAAEIRDQAEQAARGLFVENLAPKFKRSTIYDSNYPTKALYSAILRLNLTQPARSE